MLKVFIAVLISSFLWRCRGGFLGTGSTTIGRLVYWVLPVTAWGVWVFGPAGLLLGCTAYLGLMLSYAPFMADNQLKHCSGMAGIGIARMSILLLPVMHMHPGIVYFQYLGALAGLGYYLGWTYMDGKPSGINFPGLKLFGKQILLPGSFATGGAEWGEVFTGAFCGATFAGITLLIKGSL